MSTLRDHRVTVHDPKAIIATASLDLRLRVGIAFGVPQALLGITSIGFGIAIIGWVLYNSLIERSSEYSGGFFTLGIAPMLIAAGAFWVALAFKRDRPARANDAESLK